MEISEIKSYLYSMVRNRCIDIVKKVYVKMGKPVIIEYTDQLGNYNLLFKSDAAMFSLRQHPEESKIHFANSMAENIKQVHFFR